MTEQLGNHETDGWEQALRDFIKSEFNWDDNVIDQIIADTLEDAEKRAKWDSLMAKMNRNSSD